MACPPSPLAWAGAQRWDLFSSPRSFESTGAQRTSTRDFARLGRVTARIGIVSSDGLSTAEDAVEKLFHDPGAGIDFEPADEAGARAAITHLARLFEGVPGLVKLALSGARSGAETLSGDRFQGLAEIIQNADDVGARNVWFQVVGDTLTAVHDGRPIRLGDLQALATPWVSSKIHDAASTGRFGIGLMTLRALSGSVDIHCGPYHLRLADSTLVPIDAVDLPAHAPRADATVFAIPLPPDVDTATITRWLSRWDDSALLFCRHVERVRLLAADDCVIRTLELNWTPREAGQCLVGEQKLVVERRDAHASDGRSWLVHSVDAATPPGISRAHKATATTTPLALALPLVAEQRGALHAGLPVTDLPIPIRVNAQFDPVTSRQGLADTPWNAAILPLLADLWAQAVEELILEQPQTAWAAIPLPSADRSGGSQMADSLEALLLDQARHRLPQRIRIRVGDADVPLAEVTVEDPQLEGLLSPHEIAALGETTASMPLDARDESGRWREVLADWRAHGVGLPAPLSVDLALALLQDMARSTEQTIALAAAGLRARLDSRVASYSFVATADGKRVVPPSAADHCGLLTSPSPLAQQLGVGLLLHPAHLESREDARTVLHWLERRGSMIESADSHAVLRHLAAAGRGGHPLDQPLSDEQIRALRDAFERMDPRGRDQIGRDVGSAIKLAVFYYDAQGKRIAGHARPVHAYLPRAIDREPQSFALAAGTAPGLVWLHGRYAEVLRSSLGGNTGLGPQRFLRLLGAEIAPRLTPHKSLNQRFSSDSRRGLSAHVQSGPQERARALRDLGATHTIEDVDSPPLRSVALHIAREPNDARRRQRAAALLATLGRAWDRLADQSAVPAARDHYTWQPKGSVKAFWLWSAGSIPWLDDTDQTPRAPLGTRLRTPGTIAVHGPDAPGYLHPDLDIPIRREVLAELGVMGEPNTRELVKKLAALRSESPVESTTRTEAAIIYQALGERLKSDNPLPGDLSSRDLRARFAEKPGLVLTAQGWRSPVELLVGAPVFGHRRAFVPQVPGAQQLWKTLQVRDPSLDDCLSVIGECARIRRTPEGEDVAVVLETLRLMSELATREPPSPQVAKRLRKLALWTSQGWSTERPVYAVDDPALAEGLGAEYRVWLPGGRLSQFEALLEPLRIHVVSADNTIVVEPDVARVDIAATRLWRSAIPLLRADLAFNEPGAADALRVAWDDLNSFEVRTNGDLRVRVSGLVGGREAEIPVRAKADAAARILYVAAGRDLRRVDVGGRAVASLFNADRRQIAQAWLAACAAADDERPAHHIELASQRANEENARTREEMDARLDALRRENTERLTTTAGRTTSSPAPRPPVGVLVAREARPRQLVDPSTLIVVDPQGRLGSPANVTPIQTSQPRLGPAPAAGLPAPNLDGAPLRTRTAAPGFTQAEVESRGLELVRKVFERDDERIIDLRAQHGVGADAVDSLSRFYELKVYRGEEPDQIRLQHSEISRAMSTRDFFLVIVSRLEGPMARPQVRVIIDPLSQLTMLEHSSVTFAGVRSSKHSLIYEFEPEDPMREVDR